MGIFQYQILEHGDDGQVSDGCTSYDQQFMDAPNEVLVAAQFCAVLAPSFAALAILISACELICCRFHGSFLTGNILFLTAAGVQAGTFCLFAEPSFCFDGCDIGSAVYFSAFAAFAFFLSSILLCCSSRPEPCLYQGSGRGDRDYKGAASVPPEEVILPPVITSSHSYSVDGN